jgi:hypothetical protein
VKLKFLEPSKILALGLIIQTIFTILFYLSAFHYIKSIPQQLMERLMFSWILPFSTGLFLGGSYKIIQPVLERRKMPILGATLLFYVASIGECYTIVHTELGLVRSFFRISSQGYAILFVLSILAFSKSIALPSRVSGLVKILAAYSFPIYLLELTVLPYVSLVFYKFIDPVHPLLKFAFLVTGNLFGCWAIIYLLQKVLPKNYSQYILGI